MLRLTDFTAGYGATPIARVREMQAQPGEATLLLGPSGSGKTTVLLAIAGHARTLSGAAVLEGWSPKREPAGFIFQDLHLVQGLSALDNVLLAPFAQGRKQERARAVSLLERMGLAQDAAKPAQRLSRGQAQRVAIARALLMRPKLLLADEPTASLDDDACADVFAMLLEAARETNSPLVIATHDQRLKARVSSVVSVERAA